MFCSPEEKTLRDRYWEIHAELGLNRKSPKTALCRTWNQSQEKTKRFNALCKEIDAVTKQIESFKERAVSG